MSKEFEIMRAIAIREARETNYQAQAYAWTHRIFPWFDSHGVAQEFKDEFEVGADKISEVIKFIDDDWMGEKKLTFYDIESHFNVRLDGQLDRSDLIGIVRYAFLSGRFNDELWERLTVGGSGPVESQSISSPFDPDFDARVF